jgi:hypothetical protein
MLGAGQRPFPGSPPPQVPGACGAIGAAVTVGTGAEVFVTGAGVGAGTGTVVGVGEQATSA